MRAYSCDIVNIAFNLDFPLFLLSERGSYPPKWGQTLSRSYGRYIAEFLSVRVSRKPESTRLEHLCWFAVRAAIT